LDEALRTQRGVSALRRGLSLQQALNASRGDTRLLLDALVAAEQNLRDAKAYFSTGYGGQQEIEDSVNNVFVLAESLQDELKATGQKK
jgi:undecaprenyl pyrophosphate synthase